MTIREAITHLQGTLCPYKVRCNSEVTEKDNEAFDTLWNSIEKAERYRWHDLRKNPEDLPEDKYRVYLTMDEGVPYPLTADGFFISNPANRIIAWREIEEPFESEERDEKVC